MLGLALSRSDQGEILNALSFSPLTHACTLDRAFDANEPYDHYKFCLSAGPSTASVLYSQYSSCHAATCDRPLELVRLVFDLERGQKRFLSVTCSNVVDTVVLCDRAVSAQVKLDCVSVVESSPPNQARAGLSTHSNLELLLQSTGARHYQYR